MTAITNKSVSKSSAAVSLPRGLTVFKQRRPGSQSRDLADAAGRHPWEVWPEDYYPDWRFRVRKAGVPGSVQSAETEDYGEACRRAKLVFSAQMSEKWGRISQAVEVAQGKKVFATVGEILKAYLAGPEMVKDRRRAVTSMRLVLALAKGWAVPFSRIDEGSEVARRVDALDSGAVLTKETVKEYFRVKQGGEYKPALRAREHIGINQTLNFSRMLFSRRAMALCYDGLVLPKLEDYMGFPYLMEGKIDLEEEAIPEEAFRAMEEAAEAGAASEDPEVRELSLVNRCLRLLGLRSGELCAARGSWLVQDSGGRWCLDIRDRPEEGFFIKGAEPGRVPLCDSLAAVLVGRRDGFLILPGATVRERDAFIRKRHNAWLKGFIGEIRNRQGNHRLRKYVATRLLVLHGITVASKYLRHAGEAVTLKSYAARLTNTLPAVSDGDLRTWVD